MFLLRDWQSAGDQARHFGIRVRPARTDEGVPKEEDTGRLAVSFKLLCYAHSVKTIGVLLVMGALVVVILWFYYRPTIEYLRIGPWKLK